MQRIIGSCLLLLAPHGFAHSTHFHPADRTIDFPDVPGYVTLTCDFHTHSVFSDGSVWPDIRVREAVRDGLDCLAITEHLESQPHRQDLPHPDHNRAYDLALLHAGGGQTDLIVLRGAEVTRDMPPGHANAIFLEDVNPLRVDAPLDAFRAAGAQNAFIFWNHPHWIRQRPDGVATLTPTHRQLIADGLLHGIEVVNDRTYSDEALQIALDHDLTILGTSDIHGLVDWRYRIAEGGHRPVTLLLASERSAQGIRAALDARRTAVWFENTLIGREEILLPLVRASIRVLDAEWIRESSVLGVRLENHSDAEWVLRNRSDLRFHDSADVLTLPPHSISMLSVKPLRRVPTVRLVFEVLNAVIAPERHLRVELSIEVEAEEDGASSLP